MKKFFLLIVLLVTGAAMVGAQTKEFKKQQAEYTKIAEKLAKKQAKDISKAKWEYSGVLPLEKALTQYYLEVVPECGGKNRGIDHEVAAQSIADAERRLLLNAQQLYAQEVQAMLGADIAQSVNSDDKQAFDQYVSRVAAKVMHEFNGDIRRVILLKKRNPNGQGWTVRGYYVIDEEAGQVRARRIAQQVKDNNGMIDEIHEGVFGEEK